MPWALKPLRQSADMRPYDRLFCGVHSDAGGKDFLHSLNPDSQKVVTASWIRHWRMRNPTRNFNLNATDILWPTAWTTRPTSQCLTWL